VWAFLKEAVQLHATYKKTRSAKCSRVEPARGNSPHGYETPGRRPDERRPKGGTVGAMNALAGLEAKGRVP
jgi:hypothetical protein